jgi:hypothetical protein
VAVTSSRRSAHLARGRRPGRGAGGRGSGIRRGPQAAGHRGAVRGSRRAVGLASEGRGESCRPSNGAPLGEPRPPTAGHPGRSFPLDCSRPSSPFTAGGPSGPARRRCALEAVEKLSQLRRANTVGQPLGHLSGTLGPPSVSRLASDVFDSNRLWFHAYKRSWRFADRYGVSR